MSSSNSAVSAELVQAIRALQSSGQLSQILNQTEGIPMARSAGVGFGYETTGAMHDGSKRRMTSPTCSAVSRFEFIPEEGSLDETLFNAEDDQAPVVPTPSLPQGITSLKQWGQTRCDLPKLTHYKMSYAQLVTKAESDEVISEYFKWVLDRPNDRGARVTDLNAYLVAINYKKKADALTYPDSKEKRVLLDEP